jgi:hypothetical protein
MPADLATAVAQYQQLLIQLRDDLQRTKANCDVASLATVMGPAVNAGAEEAAAIENYLKADTVLAQLIAEQSPAVYTKLAEMLALKTTQSSTATLASATTLLDQGFVQVQISLGNKSEQTLTKLENKSRELLNEAEAKANVISRKRADILAVFEQSIALVTDQSRRIHGFDERLKGLAEELTGHCNNDALDTDDMCNKISKINIAQKALGSQKEMALNTITGHFGEAMNQGRGKNTDLVALTIPDNIEAGKGAALMDNLTLYLSGRADKYYALMPYVQRIISDYDPVTGMCYKPPNLEEELSLIPEELRSAYGIQSKSLYNTLISKLTTNVKRLVKSTFQYGLHEETALCAEHDGPTALFALICMFRPCTLEHTEKIENVLYDAHKGFKTGNIRKHIKSLRSVLLEAQELALDIKWTHSGKTIVESLSHKDHNMSDALKDFKNIACTDKNTTAQLDKLFAAIESQCKRDEKHDDKNGGSDKHANGAESYKGSVMGRLGNNVKEDYRSNIPCRHNPCTHQDCKFKHPSTTKPKGKGGGKGGGKGSGKDGAHKADPCLGKGCPDKSPADYRFLCVTCFKKSCDHGSIELKDGTRYPREKANMGFSDNQMKGMKSALAALKEELQADPCEDSDELDAPAGPKSFKRKVQIAAAAQQSSKKTKGGQTKEFKAFAAKLGLNVE